MAGFGTVLLTLVCFDVAAAQEQPPQTFRSAVDLVPVDVNVIDSTGKPVADLTADDFTLSVDGKPRRIVAAQFLAVARDTEPEPPPTNYSSNAAAPGGRLIMIVSDQGNIGAGRGQYAVEAASRFISRLSKSDRVGLTTIPGAGPRIDFTANHALVRTLLQKIVGAMPQDDSQARTGISEALAFAHGNEQVIAEVIDRECPEDHERLLIAMRALDDTRSAGKTIGTAGEDRQRFNRYAAAYAAAGGPEQALVSQWKKFVDR